MRLTSPTTRRYRLADHVRACCLDDQVVLLDLRRDKYVGVDGPDQAAMSAMVSDWPTGLDDSPPRLAAAPADRWVSALVEQSMLTTAASSGVRSPALPEALRSFQPDQDDGLPLPWWPHLWRLARSAWIASYWLKKRSLAEIAEEIALMRQTRGIHNTTTPDNLAVATALYMRLRPFVLTAHNRCLHDSLTLIHFLCRQGMHARWVVGVRSRPFAAHSWVQRDSLVLNDLHENVRAFRPILVV